MTRKFKGDGGINKKGKRTQRGTGSKKKDKRILYNRPWW